MARCDFRNKIPVICSGAVVSFVGIAGTLKLLDVPAFGMTLASWSLLPKSAVPWMMFGVPIVETCLAGLWWTIPKWRSLLGKVILGVLVAFSIAYGAECAWANPPNCGCLGVLARYKSAHHAAYTVLCRNILLIGVLGSCTASQSRWRGSVPRPGRRRHQPGSEPGFTIIELVLCIAILLLVIVLLSPALGAARLGALQARMLSNLRSHGTILQAYASDWQDSFPYFTYPDATETVLRGDGVVVAIPYFGAMAYWNFALADGYYDGDLLHPSFFSDKQWTGYVMEYQYSAAFLATPEFFRPEDRTGPEQWGPIRQDQVTFPDLKGAHIDTYWISDIPGPQRNKGGTGVGFVDGSAAWIQRDMFLAPYPTGEGNWPGSLLHAGLPVIDTLGGVRGRDVAQRK